MKKIAEINRQVSVAIAKSSIVTLAKDGLYELTIALASLTPPNSGANGNLYAVFYWEDQITPQKVQLGPLQLDQPRPLNYFGTFEGKAGAQFQFGTALDSIVGNVTYSVKAVLKVL